MRRVYCIRSAILSIVVMLFLKRASAAGDIDVQIEAIKGDVASIKSYIRNGVGRHETFNKLAYLSDYYGRRLSGSDELETAIDYILEQLRKDGFYNVHGENVTVPRWVRGKETASMNISNSTRTVTRDMAILGLGYSVGTNGSTLTAPVIVFDSFEELEQNSSKISGKIVVYNQVWTGYGSTVIYRSTGASRAAKYGAVASLVRSVTDLSINSPHTGSQNYAADITEIPVACITVEDAEMLKRYYQRGDDVTVSLYMEAQRYPDVISRNIVAEIRGTQFPDETVIFGGHVDTWDVGTGSMDDGGGLMISWQALKTIKALNLKPKRTVRLVLWTAEELGLIGGEAYYAAHQDETNKVSLIMESDHGAFKPKGIEFSGSGAARSILESILAMLNDINATTVVDGGGASSDTEDWVSAGVPGVELYSANEDYFFYHHSNGDTMTVLDPDDLDLCTVVFATTAYSVASLDELLPRTGDYLSTNTAGPRALAASSTTTLLVSAGALIMALFVSRSCMLSDVVKIFDS